jgi:hypothetical protein
MSAGTKKNKGDFFHRENFDYRPLDEVVSANFASGEDEDEVQSHPHGPIQPREDEQAEDDSNEIHDGICNNSHGSNWEIHDIQCPRRVKLMKWYKLSPDC